MMTTYPLKHRWNQHIIRSINQSFYIVHAHMYTHLLHATRFSINIVSDLSRLFIEYESGLAHSGGPTKKKLAIWRAERKMNVEKTKHSRFEFGYILSWKVKVNKSSTLHSHFKYCKLWKTYEFRIKLSNDLQMPQWRIINSFNQKLYGQQIVCVWVGEKVV